MKNELLELLRCPQTGQRLTLEATETSGDHCVSGWLVSEDRVHRYAVRDSVPRFVPQSNYADNFGMQWNKFSRTQLDSYSGHPVSTERFWKATKWDPAAMAGKWILDIGCGAGRFAEVALQAGAKVVALDYSTAVDATFRNLGHHANLHVVQGDVYALPFAPGQFSMVYSLGVLQHTPDVARAFAALPPMVQPGGLLCVDFYERSWKSRLLPKYWLRPLTKRIRKDRLFSGLEVLVPILLPVSRALGLLPVVGSTLKRIVPVANFHGELPLSDVQHREWSLLDTFDWLSPEFDNPQNAETIRRWMEQAGMQAIEVEKAGHLVGRGKKPG